MSEAQSVQGCSAPPPPLWAASLGSTRVPCTPAIKSPFLLELTADVWSSEPSYAGPEAWTGAWGEAAA